MHYASNRIPTQTLSNCISVIHCKRKGCLKTQLVNTVRLALVASLTQKATSPPHTMGPATPSAQGRGAAGRPGPRAGRGAGADKSERT